VLRFIEDFVLGCVLLKGLRLHSERDVNEVVEIVGVSVHYKILQGPRFDHKKKGSIAGCALLDNFETSTKFQEVSCADLKQGQEFWYKGYRFLCVSAHSFLRPGSDVFAVYLEDGRMKGLVNRFMPGVSVTVMEESSSMVANTQQYESDIPLTEAAKVFVKVAEKLKALNQSPRLQID